MKWEKVKLGEAFILQMGKTPSRNRSDYWKNGDNEWISISDIGDEKYIKNTKESITDKAIFESGIKIVPNDTVIMSFKLSLGKTCITAKDMYTNEAIMAFMCKGTKEIDNNYLYYCLKNNNWIEGTNKAVKGITLNKATLTDIQILIPPIFIQHKVAEVLDKASELINKRKKQIELLDQFLKSVFIDIFGDPVTNSKGWEIKLLSQVGELKRGKSMHRPRNDPKLLGGIYPLIQTGEISNSGLYVKDYTQTYSELGLQQSKMWGKGTLCITIAANIAKTGILTFDACFPDSVVAFLPNEVITNNYVQFWFMSLQKIIEKSAPQSAQKNINLEILNILDIPLPPLNLQYQFAAIVEQVEKQKELLKSGLEKLELIYKSLMQKAFNGELFS